MQTLMWCAIALAPGAVLALVWGVISLAAWAASDEPYLKVAPWKTPDAQTPISLEDYRAIHRAAAAHRDLQDERK